MFGWSTVNIRKVNEEDYINSLTFVFEATPYSKLLILALYNFRYFTKLGHSLVIFFDQSKTKCKTLMKYPFTGSVHIASLEMLRKLWGFLVFLFFFSPGNLWHLSKWADYLPPFPPFTLCLFTWNSSGYGKEWNRVKGKPPASLSPQNGATKAPMRDTVAQAMTTNWPPAARLRRSELRIWQLTDGDVAHGSRLVPLADAEEAPHAPMPIKAN